MLHDWCVKINNDGSDRITTISGGNNDSILWVFTHHSKSDDIEINLISGYTPGTYIISKDYFVTLTTSEYYVDIKFKLQDKMDVIDTETLCFMNPKEALDFCNQLSHMISVFWEDTNIDKVVPIPDPIYNYCEGNTFYSIVYDDKSDTIKVVSSYDKEVTPRHTRETRDSFTIKKDDYFSIEVVHKTIECSWSWRFRRPYAIICPERATLSFKNSETAVNFYNELRDVLKKHNFLK